jgi:hypothetical protein
MALSHAGFLAADLNPLGSVDARRAERSPEDSTRPRCAGWRVLKISALARVSIGWEPDDAAKIGGRAMIGNSVTGSGGAVLEFECDRDDPT